VTEVPPSPVPASHARVFLAKPLPGSAWRDLLEPLLVRMPREHADRTMMLLEESRGAWALLLPSAPGRALFVGSALSGTVPALAALGWRVVVVDPSLDRCRLARRRDREFAPGRVQHLALAGGRLPFPDDAFDLTVREDGAPGYAHGAESPSVPPSELARLTRREAVLVADNRLAYKRATGVRGRFRRLGPLAWLRRALAPSAGEATLWGHARSLEAVGPTRRFALYPDAREFSHVVGLDASRPRLTVGPRERANAPKVWAQRLGLFPVLAPSFAVLAAPRGRSRLQRALDALGERLGERGGALDQLVATRSNAALALTAPAGVELERESEPVEGGWAVHLALSPGKRRLLARHQEHLRGAHARFPALRLPEPLFEGELEGLHLFAARRLPGWTATHITDAPAKTARAAESLTEALNTLRVRAPEPLSEEAFEQLLGARIERVARQVRVPSSSARVRRELARLRERLVGQVLPLVFHHADLRAKHMMVGPDGSFAGALDLGSAEERFLPMVDLLHHLGHQRKQVRGCSSADAWHALRSASTRSEVEERCLRRHQAAMGLHDEVVEALLDAYPLLVAGMAERNWDWSRPAWIRREFGL
jgi:hypothetical protein